MTITAKTICAAGLLGFALFVSVPAEDFNSSVRREDSSHIVGSTSINVSYPILSVNDQAEWNEVLGLRKPWGATASESTSISFEKDVRVNGNWLPAGAYRIELFLAAENDLHVVLGQPPSNDGQGRESNGQELLRLAIRAAPAPYLDRLRVTFETDTDDGRRSVAENEKEEEEEEDEEEDEEKEESAKLMLHWGTRQAVVRLEMTGMRIRATPPPKIPEQIREPWTVVLSSLQALIAEDLEKHVEDFADDFESDFDDGGSAAAHVQLLGHVKRAGGLEGMAMSLEDLEWTADERTVEFRKIVIYMANGKLVLSYKLKSTDHGWKAIHLETE